MTGLLITAGWWLLGAGLCALLVAVLRDSTEGAIPRYLHARRYHHTVAARHCAAWLDARDVPTDKRGLADAVQAEPDEQPTWVIAPVEIPAITLSALETVPDPVSPFAARTA